MGFGRVERKRLAEKININKTSSSRSEEGEWGGGRFGSRNVGKCPVFFVRHGSNFEARPTGRPPSGLCPRARERQIKEIHITLRKHTPIARKLTALRAAEPPRQVRGERSSAQAGNLRKIQEEAQKWADMGLAWMREIRCFNGLGKKANRTSRHSRKKKREA